jgi:FkbM family methyltransferase
MRLKNFSNYIKSNMMDLECIIAEIYTNCCIQKNNYVLFDGGAHKAWHTLRMLEILDCVRVYAVEADPYMAKICRDILNTKKPDDISRVIFINQALQNDVSKDSIPWKSSTSHVGRSSISAKNSDRETIWGDNPDMCYRDELTVPATTIDKILSNECLPVLFIKLDLEGADLLSIFGAKATMAVKRPIIAFENSIHAPKVHGFSIPDFMSYAAALDYVPIDFAGNRMDSDNWFGFFEAWLVPVEMEKWLITQLNAALSKRNI